MCFRLVRKLPLLWESAHDSLREDERPGGGESANLQKTHLVDPGVAIDT